LEGADVGEILKWISEKQDGVVWTGLINYLHHILR
jgi:hypothetical protein